MAFHLRPIQTQRSQPFISQHPDKTSFSVRHCENLGWFAPVIIKAKILLQTAWESKVDWDEEVPEPVIEEQSFWRS